MSGNHGTKREIEVREIAADLGVADFVYSAPQTRKGNATREPSGDGLLIVGDLGAILQVKAREPATARSDSTTRAESWIKKNASKAVKQGIGSKRELIRLQNDGNALTIYPVRSLRLSAERRVKYQSSVVQNVNSWPIIVVLDHVFNIDLDLGFQPNVFWITLRDWRELHRRLRSTAALLGYVKRVLDEQVHVPLGKEVYRYEILQRADEHVTSNRSNSYPHLPDSSDFDEIGTNLFHDILDKVWPDDGEIPWTNAKEYRSIVEFLDSMQPSIQSEVGRWFLKKRSEIQFSPNATSSGTVFTENRQLVFLCSHFLPGNSRLESIARLTALSNLRHIQALKTGAKRNLITLGIYALIESRNSRQGVSYGFALVNSNAQYVMPDDLMRSLSWEYGVYDFRKKKRSELVIRRNELCPCLSGKKFKHCHGN